MGQAKSGTGANNKSKGLTADEKAAMKARMAELKAEERMSKNRAEGEKAALAAIDAMVEPDRGMARRIHEIVKANAPELMPRTWYGMPAYATKEGKIVCFFQTSTKFGVRYCTFGFNDSAHLDDGALWPVAFALKELPPDAEAKIGKLVKKAVS